MKLPNLNNAEVPDSKLADYLLSRSHSYGRHKAVFFEQFGFSSNSIETLASALLQHAKEHDVALTEESVFGMRSTIESRIKTPDSRNPVVRVVWFIDSGSIVPRLVTAYPLRRSKR
ncbi:MAG: hypothetical protein FJ320_06150 [SAR202 cluster bacterium]|nr:hypothetical protein [SAR202 cluster bacterium]